jgi:hypothetical protein
LSNLNIFVFFQYFYLLHNPLNYHHLYFEAFLISGKNNLIEAQFAFKGLELLINYGLEGYTVNKICQYEITVWNFHLSNLDWWNFQLHRKISRFFDWPTFVINNMKFSFVKYRLVETVFFKSKVNLIMYSFVEFKKKCYFSLLYSNLSYYAKAAPNYEF